MEQTITFDASNIENYLKKKGSLYFGDYNKGLSSALSLSDLIVDILKMSRHSHTCSNDKKFYCREYDGRSIGDIYRLLLFYREGTSLMETYQELLNLIQQRKIMSWICSFSRSRVYLISTSSQVVFNSEPVDEFGFDFSILGIKHSPIVNEYGKLWGNIGVYGAANNRGNLTFINF